MMRSVIVILLAGVALTGCFCVDVAETSDLDDRTVAHAYISNYGWTLFGCVPLVCGNANEDSWCPFAFFCNDLKAELAREKLVALADKYDATTADVSLMDDNDVLFDAYYAPVPWVIVYKEVNLSANLVKKEGVK